MFYALHGHFSFFLLFLLLNFMLLWDDWVTLTERVLDYFFCCCWRPKLTIFKHKAWNSSRSKPERHFSRKISTEMHWKTFWFCSNNLTNKSFLETYKQFQLLFLCSCTDALPCLERFVTNLISISPSIPTWPE